MLTSNPVIFQLPPRPARSSIDPPAYNGHNVYTDAVSAAEGVDERDAAIPHQRRKCWRL